MKPVLVALLSSATLTLGAALPAFSATVTEITDFSSDWLNPTAIAPGTEKISGIASDLDVLFLSGLKSGAQVLSFGFSAAEIYTFGNLTAGGSILYSYTPFQWGWDQDGSTGYQVSYNSWNVGTPWFGQSGSLTSTATLQLSEAFAGSLYLAIVPWGNTPVRYDITLPVVATVAPAAPVPDLPAAVPVPAAGLLLGAGLGLGGGLGGLLSRRRKRA